MRISAIALGLAVVSNQCGIAYGRALPADAALADRDVKFSTGKHGELRMTLGERQIIPQRVAGGDNPQRHKGDTTDRTQTKTNPADRSPPKSIGRRARGPDPDLVKPHQSDRKPPTKIGRRARGPDPDLAKKPEVPTTPPKKPTVDLTPPKKPTIDLTPPKKPDVDLTPPKKIGARAGVSSPGPSRNNEGADTGPRRNGPPQRIGARDGGAPETKPPKPGVNPTPAKPST